MSEIIPPTMKSEMKVRNAMADQSTLWGATLAYWDSWGVWLMIAGAILALFALAASLSSSFILWKVSGVAQSDLQSKVSDAKKEGIEAGKTAGNAVVRAAELEKQAAELRSANLKLEALIQPRRFQSNAEMLAFGASLSKFAGRRIKIESPSSDGEAALLAEQIMFGLQNGGRINVLDRRLATQSLGSLVIGILISGKDKELVSALLKNLPSKFRAAEGIVPLPNIGLGVTDGPGEIDATVYVGMKPLPDP